MYATTASEVSLDDRKQKHVSFDASSLMRSQTIATMEEANYLRNTANMATSPGSGGGGGGLLPAHSTERLIDNSANEFAYYSEMLPPDLARQLMMGELHAIAKS